MSRPRSISGQPLARDRTLAGWRVIAVLGEKNLIDAHAGFAVLNHELVASGFEFDARVAADPMPFIVTFVFA